MVLKISQLLLIGEKHCPCRSFWDISYQNSVQVPVGGYGFVCIEAVLPVCRTQFDISVKHPMLDDRELAEVVDGTQV